MKSWLQKRKKIRKLSIILLSMRRMSAKSLGETVGLLKQFTQLSMQLNQIIRNVFIWILCKLKETYISHLPKIMQQNTNEVHVITCFELLNINIVDSELKISSE